MKLTGVEVRGTSAKISASAYMRKYVSILTWEQDYLFNMGLGTQLSGKCLCNTKNVLSRKYTSARSGWLLSLLWVFWIWNQKFSNFFCLCVRGYVWNFCVWWVTIPKTGMPLKSPCQQAASAHAGLPSISLRAGLSLCRGGVWLGFVLRFATFSPLLKP